MPVGQFVSTLIHSQTSIHLIGPLLPILAGIMTSYTHTLSFNNYYPILNYLRGRGVFLNARSMDNLFLNRMNSRQGIIKKKQETIF